MDRRSPIAIALVVATVLVAVVIAGAVVTTLVGGASYDPDTLTG